MTEVGNLVADRSSGGGGGKSKKKQSPQEAWMDLLQSSVESAPPAIQSHLRHMVTTLDNIPRKEKQFRNFAMNSLNLGRGAQASQVLDAIWKHLSQQRGKQKQEREAATNAANLAKAAAEAETATAKKEEKLPKQTIANGHVDGNTTSRSKATISSDDGDSDSKEDSPKSPTAVPQSSSKENDDQIERQYEIKLQDR